MFRIILCILLSCPNPCFFLRRLPPVSQGLPRARPHPRDNEVSVAPAMKQGFYAALSWDVQWGQRDALIATDERQYGHSFVVGGGGAASSF